MVLAAFALLTSAQRSLDPPSMAYESKTIRGWNVRIERRLKEEDKGLYDQTVKLLESQLDDVLKVLPTEKIQTLRRTTIWVDFASRGESAMVYHPSRDWLIENGWNPDKADGVEISHPAKFISWSKEQPWMVLHELAHAYHDQILGFDNKRVIDAYEKAKKSGRYEEVKHVNGRTQRHYGMNNQMEFFAEMTETYFGKNDMAPLDREALKKHDLSTFLWIEREWMLR